MKALALAVCLSFGFAACSSLQPSAGTTEVQLVLEKAPT